MMRFPVLLFTLAVAAVACADLSGSSGEDPTSPQQSAAGNWVLTDGALDQNEFPIVEGYRITMSLTEEGQVHGTAACNGYGGSYEITDGHLILSDVARTLIGCEPAVVAAENAFHDAIGRSLTVDRDGERLTLEGPGVVLTFHEVIELDPAVLIGRTWMLDSLVDGDQVTTARGDPATLALTEAGDFLGSTGCRSLTGSYATMADTIRLTTFTATGECPVDLQPQDRHVVLVLEGGFTIETDGDRMIAVGIGNRRLVYRANP